jgi:hypothetical protein
MCEYRESIGFVGQSLVFDMFFLLLKVRPPPHLVPSDCVISSPNCIELPPTFRPFDCAFFFVSSAPIYIGVRTLAGNVLLTALSAKPFVCFHPTKPMATSLLPRKSLRCHCRPTGKPFAGHNPDRLYGEFPPFTSVYKYKSTQDEKVATATVSREP